MIYRQVENFIRFVSSEYSNNINCYLVELNDKRIYKDLYYTIRVMLNIAGYRKIVEFDVLFDEFIDFNTIYQQINLAIGETIEFLGI